MHPVLSPTSLLLHLFSLCRLFCGFGASAETNCTITNYMLLMGRIKKRKKGGVESSLSLPPERNGVLLHSDMFTFFFPLTPYKQASPSLACPPSSVSSICSVKVCTQHALFALHACAQLELSLTLSSTVAPLPPKMHT